MKPLKRKKYNKLLAPMQSELVAMGRWAADTGQRICVIFEGRDTAGKGGSIAAVAAKLNPRQCRIVALPKPSDVEQGQWYFQRYTGHLPARGEIVLFDRSWYNRAGVEKVMGFASDAQVADFLRQAPLYEQQLVHDGILLFKYWLTCDQEQQEKRFADRVDDPLKRWKLSPIDQAARASYAEYTAAREVMLKATDTKFAPWTLINSNDQKRARLTLIRDLLDRLPNTDIPDDKVEWPPLGHPPLAESFSVKKPIPDFPIADGKKNGGRKKTD